MLNFIHWSIKTGRDLIDEWSKYNRCGLCYAPTVSAYWCEPCRADLPRWQSGRVRKIPHVDNVQIGFDYAYPLDKLIHVAKSTGNLGLMRALGTLMPAPKRASQETVIYPVPVSKRQLLRRGFNQTLILSLAIQPDIPKAIDEVSIHKRAFRARQSSLDGRHRRRNARTLFAMNNTALRGHAIIVDDVITTGATVSAIAEKLRRHGVRKVDVLALSAVP